MRKLAHFPLYISVDPRLASPLLQPDTASYSSRSLTCRAFLWKYRRSPHHMTLTQCSGRASQAAANAAAQASAAGDSAQQIAAKAKAAAEEAAAKAQSTAQSAKDVRAYHCLTIAALLPVVRSCRYSCSSSLPWHNIPCLRQSVVVHLL